jgi:hypothetical protein
MAAAKNNAAKATSGGNAPKGPAASIAAAKNTVKAKQSPAFKADMGRYSIGDGYKAPTGGQIKGAIAAVKSGMTPTGYAQQNLRGPLGPNAEMRKGITASTDAYRLGQVSQNLYNKFGNRSIQDAAGFMRDYARSLPAEAAVNMTRNLTDQAQRMRDLGRVGINQALNVSTDKVMRGIDTFSKERFQKPSNFSMGLVSEDSPWASRARDALSDAMTRPQTVSEVARGATNFTAPGTPLSKISPKIEKTGQTRAGNFGVDPAYAKRTVAANTEAARRLAGEPATPSPAVNRAGTPVAGLPAPDAPRPRPRPENQNMQRPTGPYAVAGNTAPQTPAALMGGTKPIQDRVITITNPDKTVTTTTVQDMKNMLRRNGATEEQAEELGRSLLNAKNNYFNMDTPVVHTAGGLLTKNEMDRARVMSGEMNPYNVLSGPSPTTIPRNQQSLYTGRSTTVPKPDQSLYTGRPTTAPKPDQSLYTGRPTVVPSSEQSRYTGRPNIQPSNQQSLYTGRPTVVPSNQQSLYTGRPTTVPFNQQSVYTGRPTVTPSWQQSDYTGPPLPRSEYSGYGATGYTTLPGVPRPDSTGMMPPSGAVGAGFENSPMGRRLAAVQSGIQSLVDANKTLGQALKPAPKGQKGKIAQFADAIDPGNLANIGGINLAKNAAEKQFTEVAQKAIKAATAKVEKAQKAYQKAVKDAPPAPQTLLSTPGPDGPITRGPAASMAAAKAAAAAKAQPVTRGPAASMAAANAIGKIASETQVSVPLRGDDGETVSGRATIDSYVDAYPGLDQGEKAALRSSMLKDVVNGNVDFTKADIDQKVAEIRNSASVVTDSEAADPAFANSLIGDEAYDAAKKTGYFPGDILYNDRFLNDPTQQGVLRGPVGELDATDMAKLVNRSRALRYDDVKPYLTPEEKVRKSWSGIIKGVFNVNPLSRIGKATAEKLMGIESPEAFLSRPAYEQRALYQYAKAAAAKREGRPVPEAGFPQGAPDDGGGFPSGNISSPAGGGIGDLGGGNNVGQDRYDGNAVTPPAATTGTTAPSVAQDGPRPQIYFEWDLGINIPSPGDPLYTMYMTYLAERQAAAAAMYG